MTPQEAVGIRVVGQFRDLDDPDRFVWLRGFTGMAARPAALSEFYGGPVWAEYRETANATMVDSDNVLLLRPLATDARSADDDGDSLLDPPPLTSQMWDGKSMFGATIYPLRADASTECIESFMNDVGLLLRSVGVTATAHLQTETAPNNFPALPVREGAHVLVRLARFPNLVAHAAGTRAVTESPAAVRFQSLLDGQPRELRLEATDGSRLH